MIRRLGKKLLKSQTGHKTDVMLAHYGNHRTEGDREIIQVTEREAFAGLLPERTMNPQGEVSSTRPKLLVFNQNKVVEEAV